MSESDPRRGVGHFVGARLLPLLLCVVTVVGAACFAVVGVSSEERRDREWRAATPCPAAAPVDVRADCVTTLPGVIERTKAKLNRSHRDSWLYFSGGRPVDRLNVSYDTAAAFEAGDHVTLTWWRGELMKVASERHTANEGVPRPGGIMRRCRLLRSRGRRPRRLHAGTAGAVTAVPSPRTNRRRQACSIS